MGHRRRRVPRERDRLERARWGRRLAPSSSFKITATNEYCLDQRREGDRSYRGTRWHEPSAGRRRPPPSRRTSSPFPGIDITGARWGLPGAEALLKLRAIVSNGDFDTYWRYHLAQEHQRVHKSRYADATIPQPA
jgi:hypothetical protein